MDEKYSSKDMDLSMLDNIDLNSLKSEMESIKNVINDDSYNLSEDEKIKLQNDLELISNVILLKSHFSSNSGADEKCSKENSVLQKNVTSINVAFDNIANSGSNIDSDSLTSESLDNSDINLNSNYSVGDFVLDGSVEQDVGDFVLDGSVEQDINNSKVSVDDALRNLINNYSDEIAIKVDNVSMDFDVSMDKIDTLKEFVIKSIKRDKRPNKTVHALHNISFEIPKGDRVGIIGFNGAGKSTLLKLLASVYYPTEGTIVTKGKIAPLLELGAGFDNNYSGKDNIFLNGAFLGYSEEFLKEKYDEIVEFSELGDAINYHVKTYSSGMRAKLGFSIATIVEPDILILDEILSVGDIKFRRKSADKIKSLINSGITVLLVSHSVSQIRELCNKAIWIDKGELKMFGDVNEVCDEYVKASTKATSEQLKNLDLN